VLVMGVSGSGKTTLGKALAERLGWAFADADDYHSQPSREKMRRGQPLTDADREPWLGRLRALIEAHMQAHQPLVLACSALKQSYRDVLAGGLEGVAVVFLQGDPTLIAERMRQRSHFMPVSLLQSQISTLEPPQGAIVANIHKPVGTLVEEVVAQLTPGDPATGQEGQEAE
jgi:gluconokinase